VSANGHKNPEQQAGGVILACIDRHTSRRRRLVGRDWLCIRSFH
jgi:hypothetical protein